MYIDNIINLSLELEHNEIDRYLCIYLVYNVIQVSHLIFMTLLIFTEFYIAK